EAAGVRRTIDDGPADAPSADRADQPFVTWPELKALSASGLVDVQSHTWSHSMVFSSQEPIDVVGPAAAHEDPLSHPRLNVEDPPTFIGPERLGWPLFARQSRMSEARRYLPDVNACAEVERFVSDRGGASFLASASSREELEPKLRAIGGRWE